MDDADAPVAPEDIAAEGRGVAEAVRAAILARLNGLCAGGSGASPAVAETLAGMLNAGVHPVVPRSGSIGSGDLCLLAHVGHPVRRLTRTQIGPVTLARLRSGEMRELTVAELGELMDSAQL